MSVTYKTLRVFLCSAAGTSSEMSAVENAVAIINQGMRKHLGIQLELFTWRDLPPQSSNVPHQHKQDEINNYVRNCDVFILILWNRHGTKEDGQARTNLEREVDIAIQRLSKTYDNLIFLSYFREIKATGAPNEQLVGAMQLRRELQDKGIFHFNYEDSNDFSNIIVPQLYETILRQEFDSPKHQAMRRFWKFGKPEKSPKNDLLITYAAMDRAYMKLPKNDEELWIRRLVPNIVYEDHRALQKIEKVLRLIRMNDFHTCTLANLPEDWKFMNRCWVCIPRNRKALDRLIVHRAQTCFSFDVAKGKHAKIRWKTNHGGRDIVVRSPLETYLSHQRVGNLLKHEWGRQLRDVVAKDYAIIARLPIEQDEVQMVKGPLMEYFIGGIRGLGTWGAGWFLDRKWSAFEECKDYEPFQKLLEITYLNGSIYDAVDVSDEPASYFRKQTDSRTITRSINNVY